MLREPLLKSDKYVSCVNHINAKIAIYINKMLTLHKNNQIYIPETCSEVAKKKKNTSAVDPEYLKKQKASLVRRHRQVIYLNDKEMEAIECYCEKFRVDTKAVLYREAIMEKVLSQLDDSHPTLF